MKVVEVKYLRKEYDGFVAVNDLSFDIEKGKVYGFLGPNGAGKSTTMNMITGCLAPTAGSVLIAGKDVFEEPSEAKKHIGYLPELPPLYLDMTPKEYLNFVSEIKGIAKADIPGMTKEAMEKTGTYKMKDRLISQLSKGYKQRVGIAQAIIGYPEMIILDEPTVGLDPAQIIEIRELIRELGKDHTVMLSSHILSEVSELCDEVLIINRGNLVARDTPERLSLRLNSGTRLMLTVEGEKEAVKKAVESSEKVISVVAEDMGEGFTNVIADVECDAHSSVFFALADAKLAIHEMRTEKMSLEDIFIELTAGKEQKD